MLFAPFAGMNPGVFHPHHNTKKRPTPGHKMSGCEMQGKSRLAGFCEPQKAPFWAKKRPKNGLNRTFSVRFGEKKFL
jgi:hypothetical protein